MALAARECAQRAWAWTLAQVRHDDVGPWIPLSIPVDGAEPGPPTSERDCLYDGLAGLSFTLAEFRLNRDWTDAEGDLVDALTARLTTSDMGAEFCLYVGLAGAAAALGALSAPTDDPVRRLLDAATPQGWPSALFGEPRAPINDVVLGNAGIVLGCSTLAGESADAVMTIGCEALLETAIPAPDGLAWKMYTGDRDRMMPNYSHGTAGVATALAVAGHRLQRDDFVAAAVQGAAHVISLADLSDDGFRLPLQIPPAEDREPFAYGWCHGPTGSVSLFGALQLAGVDTVGGRSCASWRDRCLRSLQTSGLPERLRPGFWDNDGRCCGTAGVLNAVLDHVQATRDEQLMAFADVLADAILSRAITDPRDERFTYWRFHEHRQDPPDLDPSVGWMQGTAGIAAALNRYARIHDVGYDAPAVVLPDSWWMT
jgi:lantibiotic modifying enzyme